MTEKTTSPWASWELCPPQVAQKALERATAEIPMYFLGTKLKGATWSKLPFYKNYKLLQLQIEANGAAARVYFLDNGTETYWLPGVTNPIHLVNDQEHIELTKDNVADYLRFFCYFLRADEGPFAILESPDELNALGYTDDELKAAAEKGDAVATIVSQQLTMSRKGIEPLKLRADKDEQGRFLLDAAIAYGPLRSAALFGVEPKTGAVEMVEDESYAGMQGLYAPVYPTLTIDESAMFVTQMRAEQQRAEAEASAAAAAEAQSKSDEDEEGLDADTDEHQAFTDMLEKLAKPAGSQPFTGRDKEVTEAVVISLLEDAIRERDGSLLLQHFNSETEADKPLERLARMVVDSAPIIVIESDIPFVEDFVGGLLASVNEDISKGRRYRAPAVGGDDVKCWVDIDLSGIKVYLISFHAYRSLYDAERASHELGLKDAAVLIGADRLADVPEPLRRITDLVLKFPRIDRKLFARIFERVFGAKPAVGWDKTDTDWTRYLVPADFHAPRRIGLSPEASLAFLKDRVENRLKLVSAESGPKLSELNGIGEARQIAEDLIADIRSAQVGQIPWGNVDRGFLLVGRPGTGKTTLARAIAKECGIKFIVASATGWQASGALDAHLRSMRADFTEARRFAPAILFIDELDSIGNREKLSGQNAVYQTDVINGLLEQVQGFDVSAPVIVIGATNYADNIDPALRRAGRLDQVVQIPLPNIDGLEKIFEYYLKSYRTSGELAPDVSARTLAELAFGLTGADVEFFVRGAARRARRELRKINQADLLAEVTRRPRRPDSAPRLGPEEMRRVAIHEAGHTTSRLIGIRKGAELSFITIVPRMDGSLGFVASLPREGSSATRREMMEELETILAGRAAEEIVYGAADIGLGAGGASESSDLAVATSLATMLVCQSGLGANKALHWTRKPTPIQEKQIDQLLTKSYKSIVAKLRANRSLLEEVARLLVDKQEIPGGELRSLVATFGTKKPVPLKQASMTYDFPDAVEETTIM